MDWRERVEALLLAGERIEARRAVGDHELVVTSHRLLAFVDGEGPDFRAIHRPNVAGVAVEQDAERQHRRRAVKPAAIGLVALAIAALVDVSALVPSTLEAGETGTGAEAAADAISIVERLFAAIEVGVVLVGLGALVVALGFLGLYLHSRSRYLVVTVAGDDDVELPLDGRPDDAVAEIRAALESLPDAEGVRDGEWVPGAERARDGKSAPDAEWVADGEAPADGDPVTDGEAPADGEPPADGEAPADGGSPGS